jgi:hypothetical protein
MEVENGFIFDEIANKYYSIGTSFEMADDACAKPEVRADIERRFGRKVF